MRSSTMTRPSHPNLHYLLRNGHLNTIASVMATAKMTIVQESIQPKTKKTKNSSSAEVVEIIKSLVEQNEQRRLEEAARREQMHKERIGVLQNLVRTLESKNNQIWCQTVVCFALHF